MRNYDPPEIDLSVQNPHRRLTENQWLEFIRGDPVRLLHAVSDWQHDAISMFQSLDGFVPPEWFEDFSALNSRLILWCDNDSNFDPAPLQAYERLLLDRLGQRVEYRRIATISPVRPSIEEVEQGLHPAIAFTRRIEAVARAACQKWAAEESAVKPDGERKRQPTDAQVEAVANILDDNPGIGYEAIIAKLKEAGGKGMAPATLVATLDIVREKYPNLTTPPKRKKRKRK